MGRGNPRSRFRFRRSSRRNGWGKVAASSAAPTNPLPGPQISYGFGGTNYTGPSDRKLKYNINFIKKSSGGLNIYSFEYKNKKFGNGIFQGVMSDEVPTTAIVKHPDGYDMVNYSLIDVEFKKL